MWMEVITFHIAFKSLIIIISNVYLLINCSSEEKTCSSTFSSCSWLTLEKKMVVTSLPLCKLYSCCEWALNQSTYKSTIFTLLFIWLFFIMLLWEVSIITRHDVHKGHGKNDFLIWIWGFCFYSLLCGFQPFTNSKTKKIGIYILTVAVVILEVGRCKYRYVVVIIRFTSSSSSAYFFKK